MKADMKITINQRQNIKTKSQSAFKVIMRNRKVSKSVKQVSKYYGGALKRLSTR